MRSGRSVQQSYLGTHGRSAQSDQSFTSFVSCMALTEYQEGSRHVLTSSADKIARLLLRKTLRPLFTVKIKDGSGLFIRTSDSSDSKAATGDNLRWWGRSSRQAHAPALWAELNELHIIPSWEHGWRGRLLGGTEHSSSVSLQGPSSSAPKYP